MGVDPSMHAFLKRAATNRLIRRCINRVAGVVVRVRTSEPLIALTFDDGPNPDATPELLDMLAAHDAKATFFMLGVQAEAHPRLVAAVQRGGHAIGNHTWDHPSLPLISRGERLRQIRHTGSLLPGTGRPLFRPPYGHLDFASHRDLFACGQQAVAWSSIIPDWEGRPAEDLAERALKAAHPGAILVMHDHLFDFADDACRDRRPTLDAVASVLTELSGRFEFVTVPELMRRGRPVRECWRMAPDLGMLNHLQRAQGPARRYAEGFAPAPTPIHPTS